MNRRLNLNALALESAMMMRGSYVMLVPPMLAMALSFFIYLVLFSGLPEETLQNFDQFWLSADVHRLALIGAASYASLNAFAIGVVTAMSLELTRTGRTSLSTGVRFITMRLPSLLALSLMMGLSVVVGFAIMLIPGLLAALFFMYAMPSLVRDGEDPMGAVQNSYSAVLNNFRDSAWMFFAFSVAYFALNMTLVVLVFVPLFGILAALLLTSAFIATFSMASLRAYDALVPPSPGPPETPEPSGEPPEEE